MTIQVSYSQSRDSVLSHQIEIEGWEFFFEGKKEDAKLKFTNAIELDSTNYLAKIGLFYSQSESELTERDFDFTNSLPKSKDYDEIMFVLTMINQVEKELPASRRAMYRKYDEGYIEFKALLTDSDFKVYDEKGNIRRTGSYKNRKPAGNWKYFGYKNKLHHSITFPEYGDTIVVTYYKPDGDIIRKEWYIGRPFTNDGRRIKEVIYWQENPGRKPAYLFVSEEGFKVFDSQNPVEFDETTPDNFIQRIWNPDKQVLEAFIWKNGKREPYELCEEDGMVISEVVDGIRKTYRWENCKKILIE